jgi:hypothetical protein
LQRLRAAADTREQPGRRTGDEDVTIADDRRGGDQAPRHARAGTALARDGELGHKVGRSWVFTAKELDAYKRSQRVAPRRPAPRGTASRSRSRVSRADLQAAALLDRLLAEERALKQRYALPFRAPARVATTIHVCNRCGQPLVFLIFGDHARDEAGLLAYARLMEQPIREQGLRTYVIGPPNDPTMRDDAPSLLLEVWPEVGIVATITPIGWDVLMEELSAVHCAMPR